jgi:Flp pilus assembly protein TadG
MKRRQKKEEAGTVLIAFALFLFILLGFCAIGMETGRWYMVRAELSKSVDAAALVAAKNISNPFVSPSALAREFAAANFPSGYLGTPASGAGTVAFSATVIGNDKVQVDGNVSANSILAKLFGANLVPTASRGVGQKKEVEIMLVLDRSGSMQGTPIADLKTAARTFVDYFAATQDKDKMGLISFSTAVTLDQAMGTNYVTSIKAAISAMNAANYTNTEDALDQADGPGGFTDQTGIPGDQRIQQFLIFFSDGQPTAFRGQFLYQGVNYDAVAIGATNGSGDCDPNTFPTSYNSLPRLYNPVTAAQLTATAYPTGDGVAMIRCAGFAQPKPTTRWYVFDTMPVSGYAATATCIPARNLGAQFCYIANQLALNHATDLKNNRHVVIYTIGLGNVDANFMGAIANPNLYYHAPTSAELQAIFQRVAQEIKLRLVQ